MSNKRLFRLSLQFFGDGGEAQGVASDGGDAGFELTPRMAELQKKYGIDFASISGNEQSADSQPATDEEAEVTEATSEEPEAPSKTAEQEFEELISGRFKDLYEKKSAEREEKAIKKRFKNQVENNEKISKYEKALSRVAYHYGKDKADFEGIVESIDADDSWLEDEAFEKNMTTKAPKAYRRKKKLQAHLLQQPENDTHVQQEREEQSMEKILKIEGMMCPRCEAHVKKALEAIEGVVSATADHTTDTAKVTLSSPVDNAVLKAAVEAEDYTVLDIQ